MSKHSIYLLGGARDSGRADFAEQGSSRKGGGGGHRSATPRTRETYEALYSSAAYRIARSRSAGLYVVTPATTPATTRLGHSRINVLSD